MKHKGYFSKRDSIQCFIFQSRYLSEQTNVKQQKWWMFPMNIWMCFPWVSSAVHCQLSGKLHRWADTRLSGWGTRLVRVMENRRGGGGGKGRHNWQRRRKENGAGEDGVEVVEEEEEEVVEGNMMSQTNEFNNRISEDMEKGSFCQGRRNGKARMVEVTQWGNVVYESENYQGA